MTKLTKVLTSKELPLQAKAIYTYIYEGVSKHEVFEEGVKETCEKLKVDRTTFYKYRKMLIEKGFITVESSFRATGGYAPSKYSLM